MNIRGQTLLFCFWQQPNELMRQLSSLKIVIFTAANLHNGVLNFSIWKSTLGVLTYLLGLHILSITQQNLTVINKAKVVLSFSYLC